MYNSWITKKYNHFEELLDNEILFYKFVGDYIIKIEGNYLIKHAVVYN